jgi:hypothetical protein
MAKIKVLAHRNGKIIHYETEDKGKPGRTPESEQWYNPQTVTGWKKTESASLRRSKVIEAHGGDELAAARSMQALANVTTDQATRKAAKADARYFYHIYNVGRKGGTGGRTLRISPKMPRLR